MFPVSYRGDLNIKRAKNYILLILIVKEISSKKIYINLSNIFLYSIKNIKSEIEMVGS